MAFLLDTWAWLSGNWPEMVAALTLLLASAEAIVRLTPTKADDGAVERVGKLLKWLFDLVKAPNVKLEDGKVSLHERR